MVKLSELAEVRLTLSPYEVCALVIALSIVHNELRVNPLLYRKEQVAVDLLELRDKLISQVETQRGCLQ